MAHLHIKNAVNAVYFEAKKNMEIRLGYSISHSEFIWALLGRKLPDLWNILPNHKHFIDAKNKKERL